MAIQDKFLRGRIGPIVFYERNGKQVARSLPVKVRVAAVSLARATNFGHASRLSSVFIAEFKRMLALPKIPSLQQRLAGSISRWLGVTPMNDIAATPAVPWVESFRLNTKAELNFLLKQQLRVVANTSENLKLSISSFQPAGAIITPAGTLSVNCSIAVASCKLSTAALMQVYQTSFEIPCTIGSLSAQEIDLSVQLNPGELAIVVVSLLFKGKTYETLAGVQDLRWRPIEVIGAVYG